jgi:hypothetical protein
MALDGLLVSLLNESGRYFLLVVVVAGLNRTGVNSSSSDLHDASSLLLQEILDKKGRIQTQNKQH